MTTTAIYDSYSAPLLAYAPPAEKGDALRLRVVLVVVLIWALLRVAGRAIGWIHWGFPDLFQLLSATPARIAEKSFMFVLLPLFNLVLAVVAIRGLRRGKLCTLDKAAVWAGVLLYILFSGVLAWLVEVTYTPAQIQIMLFVAGRQAIDLLPLLLLLGLSGRQRSRHIAWNTWGPAIGCAALLLVPVLWFWVTNFQDAQRELLTDLSGRSLTGHLGVVRAIGQLAVCAGLLGFVSTGLLALVSARSAQSSARACTTLLLAGLTMRAAETVYIYCMGSFQGIWELYSHPVHYAGQYGGLTLPYAGGDSFTGMDLALVWGKMIFNLFFLFAFALLCRMVVAGPKQSPVIR